MYWICKSVGSAINPDKKQPEQMLPEIGGQFYKMLQVAEAQQKDKYRELEQSKGGMSR